jgi:hypothetical protein
MRKQDVQNDRGSNEHDIPSEKKTDGCDCQKRYPEKLQYVRIFKNGMESNHDEQ